MITTIFAENIRNMDIILKKTEVLTEVRKTLEYIGFRTVTDNGGNVYDILSASKEQEEMLGRFFDEGCTNIAHADKEYAKLTKTDEGYNCEFAESVDESYETFLEQDMVSYLVNYIIAQWLLLGNIANDKIQVYQLIAANFLRSYKNWFGNNTRSSETELHGGNTIGDTVDSFIVDDEGGSASEDEDGGNTIGDTVDSFIVDDESGSSCGDELEGGNEIGKDLPQGFAKQRITRYRLSKY